MSRTSLSIRDAEASMPPLDEAATAARALKTAMLGAVSGADMGEVMKGVVKRAKEGKASDIKLLMQMIAQSAPQVSIGIRANAAGQGRNGNGAGQRMIRPAAADVDPPEGDDEEELLRKSNCISACARELAARGSQTVAALAKHLPYGAAIIADALADHEFFQAFGDAWSLTKEGRAFVKTNGE